MNSRWKWVRSLLCLGALLCVDAGQGNAHIGAPDVYVKAQAGPYALLVSVHPPLATPGAAGIDIRTEDAGVSAVSVSLPAGSMQSLQRFPQEQIFTGSVWVATAGAWRVTIHVSGNRGDAETTVPVPATTVPGAQASGRGLRLWLWILAGVIALCVPWLFRRRSRPVAGVALVVIGAILAATIFASRKPSAGTPALQLGLQSGGKLEITLPGTMQDLLEDHNHLMHLFAVRVPQMDVLLHLHPAQIGPGHFETELPSMGGGAFAVYADVVHRDGRLETFTAPAGLPGQAGHVLQGDDSVGVVPGLNRTQSATGPGTTTIRLPDGYSMTLDLASALHPRTGQLLRFMLRDAAGNPPTDMQLYMGMAAHAAVLKTDGTVFAHIHPAGTIPMAAYGTNLAGMDMSAAPASDVSFPFGFPSAGTYRIFLEMKHGGMIETGAFDLLVR